MSDTAEKVFTPEELAGFTGKDGGKIYIAHGGIVYDATDSFLWKGGKHFINHFAGLELTHELNDAPHGVEMLERLPVVGRLKKE